VRPERISVDEARLRPHLRGDRFAAWERRNREAVELDRKAFELVRDTDVQVPSRAVLSAATAAGDPAKLRGLPAIGRNVTGATSSTDPVRALLSKERRRR
jgi:hypothetical protein